MKTKWLVAFVSVAAAIVLSFFALRISKPHSPNDVPRSSVGEADNLRSDVDIANDTNQQNQHESAVFRSLKTDQQFEESILDGSKLDDFIRRHLPRAQSGDADSAYYLAEAMQFCSMELAQFDLSFVHYNKQGAASSASLEHQAQVIMDGLVGKPEFFLKQVRRHIDRAIACKSIGMDSQDFYRQAGEWRQQATTLMQPVAVASAAKLDPRNPTIDAKTLNRSKALMRDVLSRNRDLKTLLHASSVVAVTTGRDYESERLAWGILACEYRQCDNLNYLYLGKCEAMVLNGNADCSEEMSDLDYLRLKYPDTFDDARGRASELHEALEKEDWSALGLE